MYNTDYQSVLSILGLWVSSVLNPLFDCSAHSSQKEWEGGELRLSVIGWSVAVRISERSKLFYKTSTLKIMCRQALPFRDLYSTTSASPLWTS